MQTASRRAGHVDLRSDVDLLACRQTVHSLAQGLEFTFTDETMLVSAASELAHNVITHGGGGSMVYIEQREGHRTGIRLIFEDHGPGITNIESAISAVVGTPGQRIGLGLSGAKRLVDEFSLESTPGVGTRVTITRWK